MHLPPIFATLDAADQDYFLAIAKKHERELQLHEVDGKLWEKDASGKDWSNVTEHCLIEAARADIFSELLCFSNEVRGDLASAALLHDFNKKHEIELTREDIAIGGDGLAGVRRAEEDAKKTLREKGFSEKIILLLTNITGDREDLLQMMRILNLKSATEEDIARLVLHYIDNYTRGSSWVEPAVLDVSLGKRINDLDRRSERNAENPTYEKMNAEGIRLNSGDSVLDGMTRFESSAFVNHLIEKKLADLINGCGVNIEDPLNIPEIVDERIKNKIKNKQSF